MIFIISHALIQDALGSLVEKDVMPYDGDLASAKTALLLLAMRPAFTCGSLLTEKKLPNDKCQVELKFKCWKNDSGIHSQDIGYQHVAVSSTA